MSEVSREEFAAAVASAISSVHHLYREVDKLIVGLRELLAEGPSPLAPLRGTLGKSGRDPTRLVMRNEYGTLFGSVTALDEIDDDEPEEELEEDQEDDDDAEGSGATGPGKLVVDQPVLGVLFALYDSTQKAAFEPHITYAVMNGWKAGSGAAPKPGQSFMLAGYMLRRIPRALAASGNVAKGGRLMTRAAAKRGAGTKKGADRRLSCLLPLGAKSVPLYSLDSVEELEGLAAGMREMWAGALKEIGRQAPT